MPTVQEALDNPVVHTFAVIIIAVIVTSVVMRLVKRGLQARITDNDLRYRASKVTSVVGYIIIIIIIGVQTAGQFSGFTVAIGAASAGIAFALQEVIASFAGWLAVALGGFFSVGHRVQLGGIKGDVIDIGFLRTTIMECGGWVNGDLYNGRIVRVANSFVFKEPVFNYSGDFPFLWDEIVIPIKYGSDYELARKILADAAAAAVSEHTEHAREHWAKLVRTYRIEDAKIEPLVTMIANDNWVELTLRYVVDHRARRVTKDLLFRSIVRDIEASEGRVGLASMTVHLVETPTFKVSLEERSSAPLLKRPD